MPLPRLATDEQLDRLHEAVLRTLEEVGFLVQNEELMQRMIAAGGIGGPKGQVLMPRDLIGRMLEPRLADPEPVPDGPPRIDWEPRASLGSQLAQFYLDPDANRREETATEHLIELTRFARVWQEGAPVGPVVLCRDVPAPVEPMESTLTIARHTDRVGSAYVHLPGQVPYLAELGSILNDDPNSFLGICLFAVTPLRLDRRASGLLLDLLERGATVWLGTQPAAGASAPATVVGTVVLGAAELLAGWVAAFCVDPEATPGAGICSGVLDMKTADVSYCAPEAMLQDVLCVELFRERYGGRCAVAGGAGYTDAKMPGSQKAFELAFEALTIYTYAGTFPGTGGGLLESGKTFSPVQFMLDHDFGRYLGRFARGVDFSDESLALNSILEVGLGLTKSHLTSDHTLGNWKGLYTPVLLDRSFAGDGAVADQEQALQSLAWEQFQAVRARYEPTSVDETRLRAVEQVVERAWTDLCGSERPRS